VAQEIEELSLDGVTVESDYQLSVEDSATVAEYDVVVFVDASVDTEIEPFRFSKLEAVRQESFSSHSIAPQAVLGLAADLFEARTEAYLMAIRGYSFAMFKEEMTAKARNNMRKAIEFLKSAIANGSFQPLDRG
jgi:hydrogenase maturation protease